MKRRSFLKASALSAAAGLLEACARDDVLYLKQSVADSQPPGVSVWRSGACQQCSAGCGIQVRTVDGQAKKIEGNPEHPVNRGGLCALGQASLQGLYNPDRIEAPLKRVGARGEGKFEEIGWEEALGLAAQGLAKAISEDPGNVTLMTGLPTGLTRGLLRRLGQSLGAPSLVVCEPHESEVERRACEIVFRTSEFPVMDLAGSDYVLSVGAPFADRWRSPVHYALGLAEMRRGRSGRRGKFVQVEPRMSVTAAAADEWLPLLPGSEGVFARAVAGVLIAEGLVKPAAVERYNRLFGADPPDTVEAEKICDLPQRRIRKVARQMAAAQNRLVLGGGSAAAQTNGLSNLVAIFGLNILLETLGQPGGVFAPVSFDLGSSLDLPSSAKSSKPRDRTLGEWAEPQPGESQSTLSVLLVCEADPVHLSPQGWDMAGALSSADQVITLSSFMDDTAFNADIILPIHTDLERLDAVEPSPSVGVPTMNLSGPVVEPVGDSRHPGDILLALVTAMGEPLSHDFPWSSYRNLVETTLKVRFGPELERSGTDFSKFHEEALSRGGYWEGDPSWESPPGPAQQAPGSSPPEFDGSTDEYPFHLLLFESVKLADGRGANRPWLQVLPDPLTTVMWDSWAEISPKDAQRLGVANGDQLRIESSSGSLLVSAVVNPAVRPGTLGIPLGAGHRDFGRYSRGRGVNPMDLLGNTRVKGTQAAAWAATRVRLERIGEGSIALFGPGLYHHEEKIKHSQLERSQGEQDA